MDRYTVPKGKTVWVGKRKFKEGESIPSSLLPTPKAKPEVVRVKPEVDQGNAVKTPKKDKD